MHWQFVLEPSHRFVQDRACIEMAGRRMCKLLLDICSVNKQWNSLAIPGRVLYNSSYLTLILLTWKIW
jgi:hypothetical protein